MTFEMIKINYSFWQKFHPKPGHLASPLLHPFQLAKYFLLSTPFCPAFPSRAMPRVPQLGCLMFLEAPSLLVQHPALVSNNLRRMSTLLCVLTHSLVFSAMTWNRERRIGAWKRGGGTIASPRKSYFRTGEFLPSVKPTPLRRWIRPALLRVK